MEKTLTSLYLEPSQPTGFRGLDAVYRAVKEKGKNKISRKQVREWLSQQDVYNHTAGYRELNVLIYLYNRLQYVFQGRNPKLLCRFSPVSA